MTGRRALGAALGLLLLAWAAWLIVAPPRAGISLPARALEPSDARGLYPTELGAQDGAPFRWSDGQAQIRLPREGPGAHILALTLAAPLAETRAVLVQIDAAAPIAIALQTGPRRYTMLAPAPQLASGGSTITIASPTITPPGEARTLGIALFSARWSALTDGWPLLPAAQLAALLLACAALWAALHGAPGWARIGVVALFLVISVAMQHSDIRYERRVAAAQLSAAIAIGGALVAVILRRIPAGDPMPEAAPRRPTRALLIPLGIFLALALLTFAPLLPHLGSLVYGPPGDNFEYLWKIGWVADSLTTRRASPLFQPDFFYPAGFDVARSELTPAHTLPGALLSLIVGPVVAYNLLLIGAALLTGLLTMLLAEQLGAPRPGAIIAGVGVSFCAFRFTYALGTLPMASTQWVILALYGWERFLQRRTIGDALIAGVGVALSAWASWYYGATIPLLLLTYTLVRVPPHAWRALIGAWPRALPGVAASAALLLPYLQPYQQLSPPPHARAELLQLAAQPLGYLIPNPFQAIWGPALLPWANSSGLTERTAIGVGLLLLALIGLWENRRQRAAIALLVTALIWMTLSLGPQITIGQATIPLPVELIYQHVPGLKNIRVWSRMAFYVQLMAGLLASMALVGYRASPLWRRILVSILAALVLIEGVSASPWVTATAPRPVEQWLAAQPRGAVLHLPDTLSGWHEFQTRTTRQPLTAGYGTFYPAAFLADYLVMQRGPGDGAIDAIRHLQPSYLVVSSAGIDAGWEPALRAQPDFQEVYRDQTTRVFRYQPTARPQ